MTTYRAVIPGRHDSTHRSEAAALSAIGRAERQHRTNGTVLRIDEYPHYHSTICVYGFFAVGEELRS